MEFTTPPRKCLLVSCPGQPVFGPGPSLCNPSQSVSRTWNRPGPCNPGESASCMHCLPLRMHAAAGGHPPCPMPGPGGWAAPPCQFMQITQTALTTHALAWRLPASAPSAGQQLRQALEAAPPRAPCRMVWVAHLRRSRRYAALARRHVAVLHARQQAALITCTLAGGCLPRRLPTSPLLSHVPPPPHMLPPELSSAMVPCLAWRQLCCCVVADPAPSDGGASSPVQPPCS